MRLLPEHLLISPCSLVQKEKRSQQLDFLKALTRLLDVEPEADFDAVCTDVRRCIRNLAEDCSPVIDRTSSPLFAS